MLGGAVGALLLALLPAGTLERLPDLCLIHRTTGRRCPGCGMTRALRALLRGDLGAAMRYNRRVIIVAPLLAALYLREVTRLVNALPLHQPGHDWPNEPRQHRAACQRSD